MSTGFRWFAWRDFDPDTLYALMRLRSAVFVVEQACAFADMDGIDAQCEHLCAFAPDGILLGALRLLPPGLKTPEPSIGRLAVAQNARGAGLARQLMERGLARCAERFPGQRVYLGAQRHLRGFYESLGFTLTGEDYLDDGIPHVEMLGPAPGAAILRR